MCSDARTPGAAPGYAARGEHGFDAHVVKPVDLDGIRELVFRAPRPAS